MYIVARIAHHSCLLQEYLIEQIQKKIDVLKMEKQTIEDEIQHNNALGKEVRTRRILIPKSEIESACFIPALQLSFHFDLKHYI
jgi:hypothetical protein